MQVVAEVHECIEKIPFSGKHLSALEPMIRCSFRGCSNIDARAIKIDRAYSYQAIFDDFGEIEGTEPAACRSMLAAGPGPPPNCAWSSTTAKRFQFSSRNHSCLHEYDKREQYLAT